MARVPNPAAPIPHRAHVQQFLFGEKRLSDQRIQMVGAVDRGAATAEITFDRLMFAVEATRNFKRRRALQARDNGGAPASSAGRSRFIEPSRDYEPRSAIFPPCHPHSKSRQSEPWRQGRRGGAGAAQAGKREASFELAALFGALARKVKGPGRCGRARTWPSKPGRAWPSFALRGNGKVGWLAAGGQRTLSFAAARVLAGHPLTP